MKESPPARRTRSLAARLVVIGVVQLLLLAATAVIIFIAEGPHEPGRPDLHLGPPEIHRLEASVDDPIAMQQALAELLDHRIEVSLYDSDRQLVGSNIDPPLAIPPRRNRPPHPPTEPPRPGEQPRGEQGDRSPPAAGPPPRPGDRVSSPPPIDGLPPPFEGPSPPGAGPGDGGGPPIGMPRGAPPFFGEGVVIRPLVRGKPGFLVARGVHGRPPGLTGPILVLTLGFAILIIGALITARWIVRPIERLTTVARALGSGNLSARSKLQRSDEIGELGVRVDEMAERIEMLLVTEKELLANVAHELRTPLSRIGVALDLAAEGDNAAARTALAEISVDVAELEALVDDVLTAIRAEVAGSLPLRRSVVEPKVIADGAASRLRVRHPERPLEVTVAPELGSIDVDPVLFRRVIDNLLENAHKYTPDVTSPIGLAVTRDGDRVVFAVEDAGIGISADDLPRVFTAFFRGDRSRSRETGGVGLGLTLAKRIVEAHGGTIEIDSELGAGTVVRVSVPVA